MNFATWPALLVVDVEGNGTNPPALIEVAALPVRNGRPDKSTAGWWLSRPNSPVTPHQRVTSDPHSQDHAVHVAVQRCLKEEPV
ncbi:hypothetical protein ACH4L5_35735 [Streptomyces sp. NPDC017405]|uniref:hypothetical protein n=1 Tax=unclassified Streptomyces TaxID=2593676 RepID=UPI00379F7312